MKNKDVLQNKAINTVTLSGLKEKFTAIFIDQSESALGVSGHKKGTTFYENTIVCISNSIFVFVLL